MILWQNAWKRILAAHDLTLPEDTDFSDSTALPVERCVASNRRLGQSNQPSRMFALIAPKRPAEHLLPDQPAAEQRLFRLAIMAACQVLIRLAWMTQEP
jgi:hypothetical protein